MSEFPRTMVGTGGKRRLPSCCRWGPQLDENEPIRVFGMDSCLAIDFFPSGSYSSFIDQVVERRFRWTSQPEKEAGR